MEAPAAASTPSSKSSNKFLKIRGENVTKKTAGSIAHRLRACKEEDGRAVKVAMVMTGVGARAVNAMAKSLATARKYLKDDDIQPIGLPTRLEHEEFKYFFEVKVALACGVELPPLPTEEQCNDDYKPSAYADLEVAKEATVEDLTAALLKGNAIRFICMGTAPVSKALDAVASARASSPTSEFVVRPLFYSTTTEAGEEWQGIWIFVDPVPKCAAFLEGP